LTGGEPMIARGIHELAAALRAEGMHITIETAGTIPPADIACDLASLSPKLANSTPDATEIEAAWVERHEKTRIQPDVLREWIAGYPFQLKFVVSGANDLPEIQKTIVDIGAHIPPSKILLMPEGTNDELLKSRQSEVIAICLEKGHRYCDRLHIHLFGNTMGT
jgi:7-carboxy-7-deazaguanine synthase